MDALIDLFSAKPIKKTFKSKNFSFVLRTLTTDELADILRRVDMLAISDITKSVLTRKITLAYSLESINGVDIMAIPEVEEIRQKDDNGTIRKEDILLQIFSKFDDVVIRNIYNCYEQLAEEREKELEELKKE